MKISIKEISRVTGFSPATVSNALNRKKGVNIETSSKIFQAAKELGYISESSIKNYTKHGFLSEKMENEKADEQIKDIHIKVADKNLPILSLSGGNQQKVVIGKGILTNPQILLLDEPSRGIDIGAKTEVFDIINQYAQRGLSILVISSELKEIVAIANRVIVLSNGKKTGEFLESEITEDSLVLASYKGHHANGKEDEGEGKDE